MISLNAAEAMLDTIAKELREEGIKTENNEKRVIAVCQIVQAAAALSTARDTKRCKEISEEMLLHARLNSDTGVGILALDQKQIERNNEPQPEYHYALVPVKAEGASK